MKSVFTQILALTLLSAAFLVSCGPKESAEAQGEVQVRIPWYEEGEGYKLKLTALKGITQLSQVSGEFVKFFFAPRVVGEHLRGIEPTAHFIKTNNVFIPVDEVSLQMATIYAHLQRLAELDTKMGVGSINAWPRAVGIGVRLPDGMVNNAFYDGKTDSMLVVPYSDSHLPIAVNAGILAHEHFHSLFYKLVIKPLLSTPAGSLAQKSTKSNVDEFNKALGQSVVDEHIEFTPVLQNRTGLLSDPEMHEYYHLVLTRALNEGLADFWAWVYTGDPDFIALSIPKAKHDRTLSLRAMAPYSKEKIQSDIRQLATRKTFEKDLSGYAYALGAQVSRVFKSYSEVYAEARGKDSLTARQEVGLLVVKALPLMKEDLLQLNKETEYYSSEKFFLKVISLNAEMTLAEKDFVKKMAPSTSEEDSSPWNLLPLTPTRNLR